MSDRIVARHVVDGIVLSTANIYFTVHDDGARVFRTAQSATPGQEAELCHEPGCRFGDIAPQPGSIYVAERNGAIEEHSPNGDAVRQAPGAAFITSMAYDGAHVALAWTQMAATWEVRLDASVQDLTFTTGANARLAMFNAAGDLYWLDDDGVVASG